MRRSLATLSCTGLLSTGLLSIGLLCLSQAYLAPAAAQEPSEPAAPPAAPAAAPESSQSTGPIVDESEAPAKAVKDDVAGSFSEVIDVRLQQFEVYVRDKKGQPVTGLTKDDFQLFEDGKEIPITVFEEVNGGSKVSSEKKDDKTQLEKLLEDPDYDPRLDEASDHDRLHLVVYVDHFNIRPQDRNRVLRYVRDFLKKHIDRQDRVMLLTYNRSVKIEREFTGDSQVILNALFDVLEHTGGRVQVDSERRDLQRELQETRDAYQLGARIRLFAENQMNDLQFTVDGLKETVNRLAGVPGRKMLLYISDGLPMRAAEDLFIAAAEEHPQELSNFRMESFQYDASRMYQLLSDAANAANVSFYTIDAAGLLGRSDIGAEVGSYQLSPQASGIQQSNLQQSLQFLADETGGQYIVNTNNFDDGLDNFATDFDYYYVLGFSPPHAGNGRRYPLDVKVKRKGVKVVRHREMYQDKPVSREMEEATLAALAFGSQDNPLRIRLLQTDGVPPIRRDDGNFTVHVDIQIPIRNLVLLPTPDGRHIARLRVWVQGADRQGRFSDTDVHPLTIEVPQGELDKALAGYYVDQVPLLMRPGDQRVAVTVRDDQGAVSSVITRVFRIDERG